MLRYIRMTGILLICLFMFTSLLLPFDHKAEGSVLPKLLSTYPSSNQKLVSNNTNIVLTFNQEVNDIDKDKVAVYLKRSARELEPVEIKQIAPGPDNKVTIQPASTLFEDKEYVVEVEPNAVVFKDSDVSYSRWISFSFRTNFLSFYDLMIRDERKLSNLLVSYLPREIIISAPKRYIEDIHILSKNRGKSEENPGQAVINGFTNIDVITKSENVDTVRIDIYNGNKLLKKEYARLVPDSNPNNKSKNKTKLFSKGFNQLPKQFDVSILVMDEDGNRIDSKKERVSYEDGNFSEVKEKYTYKTAGNSYSLYELLGKEELFNTLLEENEIKKIMIQVNR